ncbi:MAG: hypothetical protein JXJ04_20660 [Spirochaetales bacterium]|nr:hypothetical protein [Spirochaetales bacterium]
MKRYIAIIIALLLLSILNVSGETIKQSGLEIEVINGKSEFNDILEFTVTARNTTEKEKTLLATIYLDPQTYKDMTDENRSTPVYLEVPPKETVKEVFYLITEYEIPSPRWALKIDEVYDFIVNEDFDYNDYPEISTDTEETMEKSEFSITGYWKMEKTEESTFYGNWSWLFKDDGTVSIEEILQAEARLPMQYEGTYEIEGEIVSVNFGSPNSFPSSFTISGNKLMAKEGILSKINEEMSIF